MKHAAIGIRMHSGWGVLVAVCGIGDSVEVIDRRRIVTTDPRTPGANQPYHYAARLALAESERFLADAAIVSEHLASTAIGEVVRELRTRDCHTVGCTVLLASGRPLPSLEKILGSHPLIHTAEGEFFRDAVKKACDALKIPITAIREREVDQRAEAAFGNRANLVQRTIAALGTSIGPPWTRDHKTAALAAATLLADA
jgi:hypothetical protein